MHPRLHLRREADAELPFLVWTFDRPRLVASTASVGGGLGRRDWLLNATVDWHYGRLDLHGHVGELAAAASLAGRGVGLLTAVDVRSQQHLELDGAWTSVTAGVTDTSRASSPPRPLDATADGHDPAPLGAAGPAAGEPGAPSLGTVNIVVGLPVRLDDGALLNALATATEAKVEAFGDRGVDGTGTPTDSVTVLCPPDGPAEPFGGPASRWGSRVGHLVHRAVAAGIEAQRDALRGGGLG